MSPTTTASRHPAQWARPCLLALAWCLASAGLPPRAAAAEPLPETQSSRSQQQAYGEAYERVLRQEWRQAATAFGRLLESAPHGDWADDAGFWLCYVTERLEPARLAFDCYASLLAEYPGSDWADDGRRSLVRLGEQLAGQGALQYRDRARELSRQGKAEEALGVLAALARLNDVEAVAAMLNEIERTEDPVLRARMVDALEGLESEPILDALRRWMTADPSPEVRGAALETLGDLRPTTRLDLLAVADDPRQPPELRRRALDELSNDEATPELLAMLERVAGDAASPTTARLALEVLGDLDRPVALEILDEVIDSLRDPELRLAAYRAVSEHEGPAATEVLRRQIAAAPHDEASWRAVPWLAEPETAAALAAVSGLTDPGFPSQLRAAAVRTLGQIGSREAVLVITRLILDPDPEVQAEAIVAAGRNGADDCVEPLVQAFRRASDPRTRRLVATALDDIGSSRAWSALDALEWD